MSFFWSKETICVFDSKIKEANCLNKSIAVTVSFKLLLFSGLITIWLKLEFKQVYKDHCFKTILVSNYVAAKVFHWFSLLSLEFKSLFLKIKVVQDKYMTFDIDTPPNLKRHQALSERHSLSLNHRN